MKGIPGRFPVHPVGRTAEQGPHGGPDGLGAEPVGAPLQKHHACPQSVSRPQDGPQIPGVLQAVQQQRSGLGDKFRFLRHPAQEDGPLGGVHGRQAR